MLVGDPDQAIFGFRGGNVGNMLRLPLNLSRLYDMKTVRLESNYRSGSVICYHAKQLIMHNTSRDRQVDKANQDGRDGRGCEMRDAIRRVGIRVATSWQSAPGPPLPRRQERISWLIHLHNT